jgi:XTP/dITP diphosphohydrolase
MFMQKLLIASGNAGKIKEIRALLSGIELELVIPTEMNLVLQVDESGSTYGQNAAIKAQVYAQASNLLTLADDSGLEVDALGGLPGVRSARFSPQPGASDADRRRRLLQALSSHPHPWSARFRCLVAIATPGGTLHLAEGTCPGEIIPEERGTGGFGYDPIFLFPDLGRTLAELSMQEKNLLSHRARAVQAVRPALIVLSGAS